MPRERQEIFRISDTEEKERIIVLAFEGNIAEEEYFEELQTIDDFNDSLIYLHLLKRRRNDTNSAPNHVYRKLKKEAKEEFNFSNKDELWMIIDKDRWRNIDAIIHLCKAEKNMYVAVSNPCFEFWLLLHACNFSSITDIEKEDIFENRKISNKKRYVDKILGEKLSDGYNKSNPRTNRLINNVRQAVIEAKGLYVEGEEYPNTLGTHVFKVVEKILKEE